MRFSFYVLALLVLTGCQATWGPGFMPSGYIHHRGAYKAPPGREADDIGYSYSTEKNQETLHIWRAVAQDLVAQTENLTGISPQPVYLESLPVRSAFYASYDHVLREEFTNRGYTLTEQPGSALHIRYEAHVQKSVQATPVYKDSPEFADFELVLSLVQNGVPSEQISGIYELSTYGYISVDDRTWLDMVMGDRN